MKRYRVTLSPIWKNAPYGWKNPLHNMCSYLAMFPPALPNYFITQFSNPGDIVYDPFSGRGTTILEASLNGRVGIANDLNPLAVVLSRAKINVPLKKEIEDRINELKNQYTKLPIDFIEENIKMLFGCEETLPQLQYLKKNLCMENYVDNFIMAMLLGVMHGKHKKDGSSSFLSISMPNTFSMSPNYIKKYIEENGLKKIEQNVFTILFNRLENLYPHCLPNKLCSVYNENSLNFLENHSELSGKIKLIITSPPYLKVINYGKYNWIRLWMLDCDDSDIDEQLKISNAYEKSKKVNLSDNLQLNEYLNFMLLLIKQWEQLITDDGLIAIVVGDVNDLNLASVVWEHIQSKTSLKLIKIIRDTIDGNKKVTKIWGKERKGEATKIDRIIVLSKSGRVENINVKKNIKKYYEKKYRGRNNDK